MNALQVTGLTKCYDGFTLDRLDLTLPSGCILGLVGENGAGKSTAIGMIYGSLKKDAGEVRIFGKEYGGEDASLKEEIGVVPDEVGIPECLTVSQIGKVMKHTFRNWDEERFADLTRRFALPEKKPFKDFSTGMKKKTGIAIALSHGSRLLLLDEPTSGLDPVARDEVTELLAEFTRDEDHSVLISSHIVSDLEKLCDYVAFLHRGRLMLFEEKDVLLSEYGIVHGTVEEMSALPEGAVKHKKETPWGVEAIVRRDALPAGMSFGPVSMEELFVYMAKEAG